ncbi:MAG: hypothetical protein GY928_25180 [Colwellia sp.]|nr:hypothetical protein [Colwellia sp.]
MSGNIVNHASSSLNFSTEALRASELIERIEVMDVLSRVAKRAVIKWIREQYPDLSTIINNLREILNQIQSELANLVSIEQIESIIRSLIG